MIRWTYFMLLALLLACAAAPAHAQQIVVLTEEPVAEFRLPDGSVLKNAYVWRRTYDGLMIIHDGGQYFLNYKTLPPEWQAAYTGYDGSAEETVSSTPAETVEEPTGDRYRIGEVLDQVPALAPETREKLLERGAGEEFDQAALVIALLQAVLDEEREAANRCILYLEERGYEVDEVARDTLFETCPVCRGDGTVTRKCRVCRGTGDCTKCVDPVTTMGKRSSREEQSMTELGKRSGQDHDCELCEGSGKCAKCSGDGEIEAACARCRGAGKVVARMYCEIVRDKWVRNLNARVSGSPPASIMASPTVDFMTILAELPGLNTNALGYYRSPGYDGKMDTNIVVVCLIHSLVEKNLQTARQLKVMLDVEFPGNQVIDIEEYLKYCSKCGSKGWSRQDCPRCEGSGKCSRCEGEGDSMNLKSWDVACSACKGVGECAACEGSGKVSGICRTCMGLGRVFERPRCEIRRELLIDDMNEFYRLRQAGSM